LIKKNWSKFFKRFQSFPIEDWIFIWIWLIHHLKILMKHPLKTITLFGVSILLSFHTILNSSTIFYYYSLTFCLLFFLNKIIIGFHESWFYVNLYLDYVDVVDERKTTSELQQSPVILKRIWWTRNFIGKIDKHPLRNFPNLRF
jgi:hypothetical protein